MGFLNNNLIRYYDRSYQQIKDRLITQLHSYTPEITDHSESNIFVKIISMFAAIAEMLGYYIDNAAREAFVDTCRRYESIVKICRQYDYRIKARIPASADVTFTLNQAALVDINIPLGQQINTLAGGTFFTTAAGTILAGQLQVTLPVLQYRAFIAQPIGMSSGLPNQEFALAEDVAHDSVVVRVAGLGWLSKETLAYSIPADTHFVVTVNEAGVVILKFPDGINGAIPAVAASIESDFRTTLGIEGNVGVGEITQIVAPPVLPPSISMTATNVQRASGGSPIESLEQLRRRLPLSLRTLYRAVTRQDYIDVAEIAAGVARAGATFQCGKTVDVFIVPDGGGIASGALLTSTQTWMDARRMITTQVRIFPAGEIHLKLDIAVTALPNYQNVVVKDSVRDNLTDFLSFRQQEIGGIVQLSDIYQVVENTKGVSFSIVNGMTPVPYARPLDLVTPALVWTRTIQPASATTNRWKMIFVNPTQFQLYKNDTYLGMFSVGAILAYPEIVFSVQPSTYVLGNSYEFWTYPFFGTLALQEPSLPIALAGDLILTVTGGL